MYFLSMEVRASSWDSMEEASCLPLGFSARFAISWTAFRTVALSSPSSFTISSKGQCARISIFPWFS